MRDFTKPGRSAVFANNGMCATSHPLAAKVAVGILEQGGNAADAAIAGAVLLGLCEPQMTGIGGDMFVLMTPPGSDAVLALNASGRTPRGLDAEALRAQGLTRMRAGGPESVSIPGAVDGFCRLSQDWGRLSLKEVLAPAIHYAEAGVPVAPRVARDWAVYEGNLQGRARELFLLDGAAPRVGQSFRAPGQAEVLRRIAGHGREAFYEGEVAADMVASLAALGGTHTAEDFAATRADWVTPIKGSYGGLDLYEHPPNGHGATAILLLNILKHFDLRQMDPFGAERAHLEAEATKLAYDARDRFLADADHTTRLDHMLASETAAQLAALIDLDRALPVGRPEVDAVHKETIYITVVDRDRMAVSLIYSIFDDFGSGIASDRFGILLHNRAKGMSLTPGHPNEAGPAKRPMHTIIPGMLKQNGKLIMPFGVMGGPYQPAGHARFVTNITDFGMAPQAAIDAPRSFAYDGKLRIEGTYGDAVIAQLAAKGHSVFGFDDPMGGAQAIRIHDNGVLEGASDPRKDGCALGY
ncbi:MAG: gamma-glutamyltransferase [Limimaricola sp.]|uniref:gamma-glutamyltransferase family protein n=1 Tax=Limimaricola sp. TaxID=2211665 RepID=UPI001D57A2DD|nr:gamma-glutamyltransferase family protein [Limimaricola sp.]MBI1416988.1 gamma-glutamyltransferase [Limimaricola sp.]